MFIGLLASIVNTYNHKKCISLKNQQCMVQPALINSDPNEYGQGLHYYQFTINLDRCMGSCNTLNDLSNRLCVPDKHKIWTWMFLIWLQKKKKKKNESKTLTKQIPWKCVCKFRSSKCNLIKYAKKIIVGILLHVFVKMVSI